MKYEFRMHSGLYVSEVHIFEEGSSNSICGKGSKKNTKGMSICKENGYLFPFSKLNRDQARDLASTLVFLEINVCGTCISHLYKT